MDPASLSKLPLGKKYPTLRRFCRTAMATVFEMFILHEDARYAGQAADKAFDLLDRLELEFNRFHPNSDVSRINRLEPEQSLKIDLDTFACLKKSKELFDATDGSFDVTAGVLKDFWMGPSSKGQNSGHSNSNVGMNHLHFTENAWTVSMDKTVRVDLGAIGKGYAVDRMGDLLLEWEIDSALIHGGASSVRALGHPPDRDGWTVILRHPLNRKKVLSRIHLQNQAMGGSGIEKGFHIVDPRRRRPVQDKLTAWVVANDAATADALSTAFMVMDLEEIEHYCREHPDIRALVVMKPNRKNPEGKILRWGL